MHPVGRTVRKPLLSDHDIRKVSTSPIEIDPIRMKQLTYYHNSLYFFYVSPDPGYKPNFVLFASIASPCHGGCPCFQSHPEKIPEGMGEKEIFDILFCYCAAYPPLRILSSYAFQVNRFFTHSRLSSLPFVHHHQKESFFPLYDEMRILRGTAFAENNTVTGYGLLQHM
jgi:hypothetical protein